MNQYKFICYVVMGIGSGFVEKNVSFDFCKLLHSLLIDVTAIPAVSYTHLDVYKRQPQKIIYNYEDHLNEERTYLFQQVLHPG